MSIYFLATCLACLTANATEPLGNHSVQLQQALQTGAQKIDPTTLSLELTPFHKVSAKGWDGWHRTQVRLANGSLVRTELHVIEYAQPAPHRFYIFAMVRVGNKEGQVRKQTLQSWEEFKGLRVDASPAVSLHLFPLAVAGKHE